MKDITNQLDGILKRYNDIEIQLSNQSNIFKLNFSWAFSTV